MATLLSRCFYPQEGWRSWLTPILKMGIFHDLQSRYEVHRTPYTRLVGAQVLHSPEPTLIGTVEVALKTLSPWLPFAPAVPYISNLAVASPYRCQGVGKQLLFACEEIVRQWEHPYLYLHVLDDNTPARRLYAKAGYQLVDSPPSWPTLFSPSSKRLLLCKHL
ncbi:GNAT family N-acetyltransferase [Acaryochloris sp. IP29b_bin.148]|uniref:GNAT family N-acetyltransferase n=1 Tax=Acaryochloris sp. IP29b_bin.148 TaxID=2969218 RepID=UPI00262C366E|nr:GNAT family N-acetyltransferase [Acaryochloris sp. IP29b_bin.148]